MKKNKFIGDRAFYRRVFTIMIPVLIQNIITNFVSLLDNIMVGQVGTEPMSGVAIVNQLIFVFSLCIFGGLAGCGIFTAQYYGKGDHKGVRETMRGKLYFGLFASLLFVLIFIFGGDSLIRQFLHQGTEALDLEATFAYGKEYMRVMLFGLIPFAVMQSYSSTLRETGQTMVPMKAGIAAVLVNLVFNWILIFGKLGAPALGVVGAAIATVLSRFVEAAIVIIYSHRHTETNKFATGLFKSPKIGIPLAKKMIVKGFPLLCNEVLWSVGMTTMNQCYSLRGLEVVSAINISSTVSNLFFCAFFATGSTISIMIGHLLGAGELDRAVDEDRKLISLTVIISIVVGGVLAALAKLFPEIYNTTAAVKNLAASFLTVSAVIMPVNAFCHSCYFTLRTGGKTIITFIFDSAFMWLICVPLAFIISRYTALPIIPMFAIIQLTDLIKGLIGFIMVRSRKWAINLTVNT